MEAIASTHILHLLV